MERRWRPADQAILLSHIVRTRRPVAGHHDSTLWSPPPAFCGAFFLHEIGIGCVGHLPYNLNSRQWPEKMVLRPVFTAVRAGKHEKIERPRSEIGISGFLQVPYLTSARRERGCGVLIVSFFANEYG